MVQVHEMIQLTKEEVQNLLDILLSHNAQEFRKGADAIARLQSKLEQPDNDLELVANLLKEYGLQALDVVAAFKAHTDHPLRHYDRTCPACQKGDVETEFIKAWNADKVFRVSDGKRPSEFEKELVTYRAHVTNGKEKLKEKNT